ncbi:hypothetical protein NHX12_019982 [Muraenolepis orangiensis]|uniref:Pleckstrin 2 n=1 Tax=Muraenolepis orangiensis TaxID=630683 RepID=A0A9Q0IY02_9TELE|nr:hypothetical protein NHX12_019982 [Muraenolepis orangiensis]
MDHKNSVLREGFLVKRARWFVLTPDKLLYYKYEGSKRNSCQRGRVMLRDCEVTCPYLEYDNRPLVFKLRTKSSVDHFLEACSREERDQWASSIASVVEELRQKEAGVQDAVSTSSTGRQNLHDINLSGIKMTSHVEQGSTYSNCFSGSAVVDWLVFSGLALGRVEGVTLASAVMEEGFLRPLGQRSVEALRTAGLTQQFLDDSSALYCFAESFKKRGTVTAETSLAAVELSGHVTRRGYLLKQSPPSCTTTTPARCSHHASISVHLPFAILDDDMPVGGFPLRGCLVSALHDNGVPSGVKGEVQGNLFKIITKSDTHYYIQAPTLPDKMDWIDAIRKEI